MRRTAERERSERTRRFARAAGGTLLALGLSATAWAAGAPPAVAAKKIVHADAYFLSTKGQKASLDDVSTLLILETPPLPAGNYLTSASVAAFAPVVLTNGLPDANNYVDCYINAVPNKTSTFTNHYAFGYAGEFTLPVEDVFLHVKAGTQLGLYCYENVAKSNAAVDRASLEAVPYGSISVGS